MSKETRARKRAHLERKLEAIAREIRAIETDSRRADGSRLAAALGVEHPDHCLRVVGKGSAPEILRRNGFADLAKGVHAKETRPRALCEATEVARGLQLEVCFPLRELVAERRRLEASLRN